LEYTEKTSVPSVVSYPNLLFFIKLLTLPNLSAAFSQPLHHGKEQVLSRSSPKVHRPGSAAYNGDIFIAFAIDNYSNPGGGTLGKPAGATVEGK
jgi:hypothetical protein